MKASTIAVAAVTGLAMFVGSADQAQAVVWGGSDGEYTVGTNWIGGSVPNTAAGGIAQINAGNVTYTPGGDLAINNGGKLQINGGSWTQVSSIAWIQLAGGTLEVTGGTFNQGTSGNIVRNAGTAIVVSGGTANFSANLIHNPATEGAITLSGTGTIAVQNEFKPIGDFTIAGGTLDVGGLISFADGPGSIFITGGKIVLDGANVFSGIYPGTGSLNFQPGSTGSIFFETYTLADLTADGFMTNGRITHNGVVDAAAFQLLEINGGVNVQLVPVPEPASVALAALGGLMLIHRRRRA